LVNAYLAIPKVSEALRTAKEALQLMPKDARAVLLVGRVLAHTPGDGRKKASKAYAKALKLDPLCVEAATAFADLYLQQHEAQPGGCDMQPAVQVLLQTLQHQSTDALHVKLGMVYLAATDYGAALTHFHSALSYNPDNDEAKHGVDRLTKLLQGADPDADEEGDYDLEENEDDDSQGI
jgi:Flp pilus assembly protein TadD